MACSQWWLDWSANGRRVRALNLSFNPCPKSSCSRRLTSCAPCGCGTDACAALCDLIVSKWTVTSQIFQCDNCECECDDEVRLRPCDLLDERAERDRERQRGRYVVRQGSLERAWVWLSQLSLTRFHLSPYCTSSWGFRGRGRSPTIPVTMNGCTLRRSLPVYN